MATPADRGSDQMRLANVGIHVAVFFAAGCVPRTEAPVKRTAAAPPQSIEVQRAGEDFDDLQNWVAIVRNPNVVLPQRVFNARKLVLNEWPEAQQAAENLLDNSDRSGACVPVCMAIARNGPPSRRFAAPLIALLSDVDVAVRREAAKALGRYESQQVLDSLVAVINDPAVEQLMRESAIDAITQNENPRQALSILVSLLQNLSGASLEAVYDGLRELAGVDLPDDIEIWQTWWEKNKNLSQEDQYRRRIAQQREQIERLEAANASKDVRIIGLLESYFLKLSDAETPEQLKKYLVDDLAAVRLRTLGFVQTDIGEGNLPDPEVADVLRSLLADPSEAVREGVLKILGHLRDIADAPAVVQLLSRERDETVRRAAIETLGELSNLEAVPVLVEQLRDADAPTVCVIAAAKSLGQLYAKSKNSETAPAAVADAIVEKYESSTDQPEVRAALVYAMASIADEAFVEMLLDNLRHDQADVRRRCISGLSLIGDPGHLEVILSHLNDSDVGVRGESAVAIGKVSRVEAHLDFLFIRLSSEVESDAGVRQAVWSSFVQVWNAQDKDTQFAWASRKFPDPKHQVELLKSLEERLADIDPPSPRLLELRTLLAEESYTLKRFTDAVKYWGIVEDALCQSADPGAHDATLNYMKALLRTQTYDKAIDQARKLLQEDLESQAPKIRDEIFSYLREEESAGQKERIATFLGFVRGNLLQLLDDAFEQRLKYFEKVNGRTATDGDLGAPQRSSRANGAAQNW